MRRTRASESEVYVKKEESQFTSDVYGSFKGRMFGTWPEEDERSNGHVEGDLIDTPPYFIESLWRDEMDLLSASIEFESIDIIGNTTNGTRKDYKIARSINDIQKSTELISRAAFESHLVALKSNVGKRRLVGLDTNAGKAFTVSSVSISNNRFLPGTMASDFINKYVAFLSDGLVPSPLVAGKVYYVKSTNEEGFDVSLTLGGSAIDLTDAGSGTIVAYFHANSIPNVIVQSQLIQKPEWEWSHQSYIRNQFVIGYAYNYATKAFEKSIVVDEGKSTLTSNTFTPGSFIPEEGAGVVKYGNGASTSLCGVSQSRFGIKSKLEENLIMVYDDATANLWTKKIIEWRYAPHIIMKLVGRLGTAENEIVKSLVRYEHGDHCYVNHPLIEGGISNAYPFMVDDKIIHKNERAVSLRLISMR